MSTQDPDLLKDAARVQGGKDDLFFLHQRREQLEAEIAAEKAGPDDLDRKIADARNRLEQLQAADPPQFQGFQADTGFPGTTELAGPMPAGGQGLPPEPGLGSAADRGMTEEEFFDSNPLQGLEQPEGVTAPDALAYLGLRARSGLESLARPAFRLFNSLSRLVEGGALRAGQAADWVVEQATGPGMSDFTGMAESMQRGDLEPEHITRLLERPQTKEAQAGVEQRVEKAFPALKRIKRWVDMGAETIGWVLGPPGQMVGAVAGRTQAALQGAGMSAALAHPAGFATGIFTERLAESQDPVEALRATAHVPMYLVAGFGGAKFAKLASKVMPQRLAIAAGGMAEGLAFTGLNTDTIQHGVRILGERTRLAAKLEAAMAAGEDTTAIAADIEQLDQEWEGVIDEAISGAWAFGVMKGAMAKVPRETKEVRDGLRKKDAIERPKDREAKVEGARPAEEATPRPEVAPPDLSRQPMRVLREQAKEAGLTGTSKLRKDELILQLEMHKRGVEQKAKAQEEAIAREPVIDPKAPPPATPEAGFARLTGETGATAELGMAAKGILPELDRKLSRGINWMERRLGTPGKRLAKAARIVTQKSGARQGKNIQEVRKVLDKTFGVDSRKLGGEQLVDLTDAMKFVNGYRDAGEISPRARKLAEDLRASADKSRDEWIKLEGETRVGNKWVPTTKTGEYFPQVPNKVGIKKLQAIVKKPNGKAAHAAAQFMVDRGLAKDVPAALRKVEQYLRDHVTTNNPNLQRTRVKLPEEWIEWDPRKVLPRVLEKNWISVEAWREWGKRLNSLDSTVAEISSANEAAGRRVKDFFDAEVGFKPPQDVSPGSKEFRSLVGNYLTASKLSSPLSTIRNAMQLLPNTALLHPQHVAMAFIKYPPIARMWLKASREIEMEMERAGAVRSRTQLADIEQGSLSSRLAGTVLKPFTSQEKANQVRAAFAAKLQMEADAKILMKHAKYGPRLLERLHVIARILGSDKASLERRAKKLGITDAELIEVAKTGKFTNDQLEMASFRMMQDTQFALTMASRRLWETRHPWAKIMFKFKAFGLDQLGMMRDHVVA